MTWKIESAIPKNFDTDTPLTELTITNGQGEVLRRDVRGDVRNLPEEEQIKRLIEKFYADELSDKFQNESIVKLDEARKKLEDATQVNVGIVAGLSEQIFGLRMELEAVKGRLESKEETPEAAEEVTEEGTTNG
ncbi:MAG: hypothetical protein F6I01_002070 [Aerococcus sanguinicola]